MIGGRHAACPDPDDRCQHGQDLTCPKLGEECISCFGQTVVPNTHGREVCPACNGTGRTPKATSDSDGDRG